MEKLTANGQEPIAKELTQTSQNTQTIRTLQYNQRDLDKNSQNTHTQACAGHPEGDWLLAISFHPAGDIRVK
jgi:hypothetical protein